MAETPINWSEAFDRLRAWDAEKDATLRALSTLDPEAPVDAEGTYWGCFFCTASPVDDLPYPIANRLQHREDCPWARARKLFPPAPPEPVVPMKDFDEPGPSDPPTNFGTLRLP